MTGEEAPRATRAHPKNTKRWCRGKKGVEHVTALVIPENAPGRECSVDRPDRDWASSFGWEVGCYHVEACSNCGKHVRPFLNKGECPTRIRSGKENTDV